MRDRGHLRTKVPGQNFNMGDPEEPTSLTPCLAQRNGSQEAGEKDDEDVDGGPWRPRLTGFTNSEAMWAERDPFFSPYGISAYPDNPPSTSPFPPSNTFRPPRPPLHCTRTHVLYTAAGWKHSPLGTFRCGSVSTTIVPLSLPSFV